MFEFARFPRQAWSPVLLVSFVYVSSDRSRRTILFGVSMKGSTLDEKRFPLCTPDTGATGCAFVSIEARMLSE